MRHGVRFGVGALLALSAWGCGTGEAEVVGIQTVEVARGNLRITAEAVGSIEPVRKVEVKSKASGEILRLHADVGDFVQPGALLAQIDPRDVQNRLDQARADLDVAEAQASNITAQLGRNEELHAAGVITDQDLESSRLQFTNTQANLIRSRANFELAELQLGDVTIRAPMAGTILQKNVEEGTVIQSASGSVSGGTALFVMASLEEMQVRTLVDETDIGQLRPGLPTAVTVQAHPGRRFEGEVQQIEPQAIVQQNVTKFPVIISLDNREGLLKPGMNGEVEILIDEANGVLLLANTAMVSVQDALPAARSLGIDESAVDLTQLAAAGRGGRGGGGGAAGGQVGGAARGGGARGGGGGGGGGRGGGGFPAGGAGAGNFGNRVTMTADGTGAMRPARPMVVFVAAENGALVPRVIQIGLNDWDRTEILSGLDEGDHVALVGAAQLQAQQQAMANRMGGGLNLLGNLPGMGGGRVVGGGGGGRGGGRGF